MKCMSCEMIINPQWKHAIDMNICPFCGKAIMEEHLKNLFSTLRETMDSLVQYPDQLNDWLLSNHNYIKTDSSKIIDYIPSEYIKDMKKAEEQKDFQERADKKFIVKVRNEAGVEEDVVAEKIQSEEKTNDFFKRAEAIKPNLDGFQSANEKNQHLKSIVQKIKSGGSTAVVSDTGAGAFISPEMMENADPEAVAEWNAILNGGPADSVSSSLPDGNDDDIPSVVLAMASRSTGKGNGTTNSADLLKLQQMQERVKDARSNFESGANRGGKNGFSRSS